ncbi:MAG: MerR family transcriptional regulator [Pseudomonadota bacterium]
MHRKYAIGEVAQLTGLSSHNIRKWEERHGAVAPQRTEGGSRRYTSEDVSRLTLLKELVDSGESISELAALDDSTLKALCVETLQVSGVPFQQRVRVGVLGESLPTILLQHGTLMPSLAIVLEPFEADAIDMLIVEQAGLDADTVVRLNELRDRYAVDQVVVLYGYAPQSLVLRISDEKTACLRMPINYVELQRTVLALSPAARKVQTPQVAPPRFSKQILAQMSAISTNIDCECPHHVADLLLALTDFETYSANCEDRNPLDAAVHNYLRVTAAHARAAFEQALATVAAHENIPLEQMVADASVVPSAAVSERSS